MNPEDLRHGVDGLPASRLSPGEIELRGWCIDASGAELKGVRVRIDAAIFKAARKQTRWDVALLYPDFSNARESGYRVTIVLPRGKSVAVVEARTASDQWVAIEEIPFSVPRLFRARQRRDPSYLEWFTAHPAESCAPGARVPESHRLISESGTDVLPHAEAHFAAALRENPDAVLAYSDGFHIGDTPNFKPDFSIELMRAYDLCAGCFAVRGDLFEAGVPRPDLALQLAEQARPDQIVHVPHLLYRSPGAATTRPWHREPPVSWPRTAIVVPTRDQAEVLGRCLRTLTSTDYPDVITVLVDNGTADPAATRLLERAAETGAVVVRDPAEFNFARLCNNGAAAAVEHGAEVLVFLNNDTEITDTNWLRELVTHAVRPDVGAVGARLLFPDGTLQHAGVFLGFQGAAGHLFRGMKAAPAHCFGRDRLTQQLSAVTAACLAVEAKKFAAVGGMDAEAFAVAYNDVDLCLRLAEAGFRTLYEPRAVLVHHESKSRAGSERSPEQKARANREIAALQARWGDALRRDPFYSPNLTLAAEDAGLRWTPIEATVCQ